jgi:hypothetical protein
MRRLFRCHRAGRFTSGHGTGMSRGRAGGPGKPARRRGRAVALTRSGEEEREEKPTAASVLGAE